MAEPAKARHRWSFSLRTLFVVVTLVACWLGWEFYIVRTRVTMLLSIRGQGGHFFSERRLLAKVPPPKIAFWREWIGDIPVAEIRIADNDPRSNGEVKKYFPEAFVYRYSEIFDEKGSLRKLP